MRIEYKQFIIPANPSFVPAKDAIKKVDVVLSNWQLKNGSPKVYNLNKGENTILSAPLESLHFEGGIAINYAGVDGKPAADIIGESHYDDGVTEAERRIENFMFIVGWDYRIHLGSDEISINVIQPPCENALPIEPYCAKDEILHVGMGQHVCLGKFSSDFLGIDLFAHYGQHAQAYTSSPLTTPPTVEMVINDADKKRMIGPQHFLGYWRTAVIIDFGKDLPKRTDDIYKIKNKAFINDLETALGCETIEIGHFY